MSRAGRLLAPRVESNCYGEPMAEQFSDIARELESVSERLGDLSMALLRDALEQGRDRPAADRVLAQARRSVDKAADLLRGLGEG